MYAFPMPLTGSAVLCFGSAVCQTEHRLLTQDLRGKAANTRCICELSCRAQPYLPYTRVLLTHTYVRRNREANSCCWQTECRVLALQELETIAGSDSQNLPATRQAASAVGQLLGSAAASRNSSGQDLAMQSTSNEHTSPQLVAARNMHKENDERFDETTEALEQDLCDSPNQYNPREGAFHHPLRQPLPLYGFCTRGILEQTSCSRLLQHVLCYSFIMYCGTHPAVNTYQQ